MTDDLLLTAEADLTVELRDEATREIAIRLLPYDEIADRGTYTESFARGAHEGSDPTKVIVRDAHRRDGLGDILGAGTAWESRDDAAWLLARAAETPEGDRALAIARLGVLRASAGFYGVEQRTEQRDGRRHIVRSKINVVEAGLLTEPAYRGTAVFVRAEEQEENPVEQTIEVVAQPPTPPEERADDRPVLAPAIVTSRRTPSAAEYAVLQLRASTGDARAAERIMELRQRLEVRELEEQTTADVTAGALPPAVTGDLVNRLIRRVPLLSVYTRATLPEVGMTFNRPKVTQHSLVGYQTAEKTAVASRDVKIDADPVSIFTVAGALNVSRQFMDRTPYWGRVFDDMVAAYGNFLDAELAGAGNGTTAIKGLATFAGTPTATGATPDGEKLATAIYTAWAALADGAQATSPDVAVMSATTWASIAKMVDGSKRPLFPSLMPSNADGTASLNGPGPFFGLPVVLDKNADADTIYLVIRDGVELYTAPSGDTPFVLRVDEPGILGVEVGIYGYLASYAKPDAVKAVLLGAATP